MRDALAIVWKEWREVMGQRGLRGKIGILVSIGVFGIAIPLQSGAAWVTSPITMLTWSWMPMFLVMMVISDAFAGERERHTLETLLATRLGDRAILFGKMGAAMAYAAAVTVCALLLGLVTVNVAFAGGGILMYRWSLVAGMIVFGFMGALFVASLGVIISLRSPTVRQAEQTLGAAIILALVIPIGGARVIPAQWKSWIVAPENAGLLGMFVVALLVAADAGLLWAVSSRFQRSRLIAGGALD